MTISKLFNHSFENEGETPVVEETPVTEEQIEQITEKLADAQREIQEAQEIVEEVEKVEETEETLERMEEAETDAERVEIATESLLKSIGYPVDKKTFSVESFSTKVEKVSSIAMESATGRVGNALSRMFTSKGAMVAKLDKALAKLEDNGPKEEVLKDPSWSKDLVTKVQTVYTAKDVIELVKSLDSKLDEAKLAKAVESVSILVGKVLTNKIESDKEKGIAQINEAIDSLEKDVAKALGDLSAPDTIKEYPDFEPIDIKSAKALYESVKKGALSSKSPLQNAYKATDGYDTKVFDAFFGGLGFFAIKLAVKAITNESAAKQFRTKLGSLNQKLSKLVAHKYKVAYAVIRYIEASAK